MQNLRKIIFACVFILAAAATANAQNPNEAGKTYLSIQTGTGAPATPALQYPWIFGASLPGAGTVTLPGGSPIALQLNGGDSKYKLNGFFQTQALLDAAFPNGSYTLTPTGSSAITLALTGNLYPATVPQVVGGTWQNGVLVIDSTQNVTINFNTFAAYGSAGAGSYEDLNLSSQTGADNVNLSQLVISAAISGLTQSATPFTSYSIPAGTLKAGAVYQLQLQYGTLSTLITTSGLSIADYQTTTYAYIGTKSTPAVPAPTITAQPSNQTGPLGSSVTFAVGVAFGGAQQPQYTSYNWYFNGQQLDGSGNKYSYGGSSTTTTLTVNNVSTSDVGTYGLEVITAGGLADSQYATLAIGAASAPTITAQPQNQTVNSGNSFTFSVSVGGTGPFSYQWLFNNVAISGATQSSYSFGSASAAKAGVYSVSVTNSGGTVTSNGATLTVNGIPTPPSFTTNPSNQTVVSGTTVVFTVGVAGSPTPSLQWMYNGVAIGGANSTRLVVSNATAVNTGNYTCFASNSAGSLISTPGTLSIDSSPADVANPGRLINLSVNTAFVPGMTLGFSSGGAGTSGTQTLLVRASGPALTPYYGASGVLPDPTLAVHTTINSVDTVVASNAGWSSTSPNQALVTAADAATYAFALTPGSLDSATVVTWPPGSGTGTGTMIVGSTGNNSGRTIAEIYDDTAAGAYRLTTPRLINVSCKILVAANGSVTAGFTVGGSTAKSVLIRASGPALAAFGVTGVMPDPQLTVYNSAGAVIARSAGWGGDPQLTAAMTQVYAFTYTSASSADSAVLLTLPAGSYTAQASSVSGTAGVTLVEVYEVP